MQHVDDSRGLASQEDPCTALEHALLRASTPEAVYRLLVHDLAEVVGATAASVALLDSTGEWIEVVTSRGYAPDVVRQLGRFRSDADLPLADAVRTDRVLIVTNPQEIVTRYSGVRQSHLAPRRMSIACIPIRVQDHVIGAIGLSFEVEVDPGGPLRDLFDRLAGITGAAVSRTLVPTADQADQLVHAARSRLSFLSAATRELARSLDQDEVLDSLTQLVVPRFADWASVLLPHGEELVAATLVHRDHQHDDPRRRAGLFRCPIDAATVSAQVFRTGQSATVRGIDDDVRARMAAYPELHASLAATRMRMIVPITVQDRILGVITLGDSGHCAFDEDDLTVAVELATRAGTALDNAARYAAERNMVEVLQRAVLPASLPDDPAYRLAASYLPSSVQAKVGGDWYDAFELRDGRIGLCVGDVVGHGIEAAACMGQLRNTLRAYALDGQEPPAVVTALNAFTIDTSTTDFATLVYAIYDPATGALAWTNAGHPPLLHRHSEGVDVLPSGHGLPIGVADAAAYSSSQATLAPGDLVAVFTDGLVESRAEPIDLGLARLANILDDSRHATADDAIDRLVDSVLRAERRDDVCVLTLEHHGR